jgi:hypothetical protein
MNNNEAINLHQILLNGSESYFSKDSKVKMSDKLLHSINRNVRTLKAAVTSRDNTLSDIQASFKKSQDVTEEDLKDEKKLSEINTRFQEYLAESEVMKDFLNESFETPLYTVDAREVENAIIPPSFENVLFGYIVNDEKEVAK